MSLIWKDLTPEQEKDFVKWALDNWKPGAQIDPSWHPLLRNTWGKLDAAFSIAKRQIMADYQEVQE